MLSHACNEAFPLCIHNHSAQCFSKRKRLCFRGPVVSEVAVANSALLFIFNSYNEAVLSAFLLDSGNDVANALLITKA